MSLFRRQCEFAFADLQEAIKDMDERGSWARLAPIQGDYLHTDGSMLGQVTHVAGCKVLYASAAFMGFEIRLKEITERTIEIGSDWTMALAYLDEAQDYWMKSWEALQDEHLNDEVATNWGEQWPAWKVILTMAGHDHYHAGQIALTRAVAAPCNEPPPPISDAEIEFLQTFPAW